MILSSLQPISSSRRIYYSSILLTVALSLVAITILLVSTNNNKSWTPMITTSFDQMNHNLSYDNDDINITSSIYNTNNDQQQQNERQLTSSYLSTLLTNNRKNKTAVVVTNTTTTTTNETSPIEISNSIDPVDINNPITDTNATPTIEEMKTMTTIKSTTANSIVSAISTTSNEFPIRINSGSSGSGLIAMKDSSGNSNFERWSQDQYYNGGTTQNVCAQLPGLSNFYCTGRTTGMNDIIQYNIPNVQSGQIYSITLHFIETYWKKNDQRIIDIYVNDILIKKNIDYYQTFGYLTPGNITFTNTIVGSSPTLSIKIQNGRKKGFVSDTISNFLMFGSRLKLASATDKPILNGIEIDIIPTTSQPTMPPQISSPPALTTMTPTTTTTTFVVSTPPTKIIEQQPTISNDVTNNPTINNGETTSPLTITPTAAAVVPVSAPTTTPIMIMTPTTTSTPLYPTLRINSGSSGSGLIAMKDTISGESSLERWSQDQYYIGGTIQNVCAQLPGLSNFYCTSRTTGMNDIIQYNIPNIQSGQTYEITLYFIETYWKENDQRIIDIYVNDILMKKNIDYYQTFGYLTPGNITFTNTVLGNSPTLNIKIQNARKKRFFGDMFTSFFMLGNRLKLASATNKPILNGIEINIIQITSTIPPKNSPPPTPTAAGVPVSTITATPVMITPTTSAPSNPTLIDIVPFNSPVMILPSPMTMPVLVEVPINTDTTSLKPIVISMPIISNPVVPTIDTATILPFRMNIGNGIDKYIDTLGQEWLPESYLIDTAGNSVTKSFTTKLIRETFDDTIYQYIRVGSNFGYQIPLPVGIYEINLHFVEYEYMDVNQRVFNVQVESTILTGVDILKEINNGVNGRFTKYSINFAETVDDGILNIQLNQVGRIYGLATVAGIEVQALAPHSAHAVSDGPYSIVDTMNLGFATVRVDASNSHTHGLGMDIVSAKWSEENTVLATELTTDITLPVGIHEVTLTVTDSSGSKSSDQTTITVNPAGFPEIDQISPNVGSVAGGELITITGSGFGTKVGDISITFGNVVLKGSQSANLVDDRTITVRAPPSAFGKQVLVSITKRSGGVSSVRTPSGERILYTYVASSPITFKGGALFLLPKVTVVRFGPDKWLYVATANGKVGKYLINFESMRVIGAVVNQILPTDQNILGIAFDPMENDVAMPKMYISHSFFFHKEPNSSSGQSINGKIRRVFGPNLDQIEDIITGLPVSDHDHGINAIEFGNNGELYISIGSNTNGGKPGKMSTTLLQKESFLSSTIVVAYLQDPNFSGTIRYSKDDDGDLIANGIEVFAYGVRNAYGMIMHSNGNLYATDNGANVGYGNMLTGCGPNDFIMDKTDKDKLLLVQKYQYYGHPNPKRAEFFNEPRQCVWHPTTDASTTDYTAPIGILEPSSNGIIDYHANYFDGQLRDNLIISKYGDGLTRIILTPDGTTTIKESFYGLPLVGDKGLDLTLAPDGSIIEARYVSNSVYYQKPVEAPTRAMKILAVFPHRGRSSGGNILSIYGINFDASTIPSIGRLLCLNVKLVSAKIIECKLPGGLPGPVDVILQKGSEKSTFLKGYKYITGLPII